MFKNVMKENKYNTGHEYDQERGEMAEMERLERDYQELRQGHAELIWQNKYLRRRVAALATVLYETKSRIDALMIRGDIAPDDMAVTRRWLKKVTQALAGE